MSVEQERRRGKLFVYGTIVVLLIAIAIGITYAFFSANVTNNGNVTVDVTTSPQVEITFENGADLDLFAHQPGVSETGYFDVKIDSDGSNITGVYNVVLNITKNEFVHDTTPGETTTAELTYDLYYSMDTGDNKTWTAITTGGDLTAVTGNVTIAANEILSANNNTSITKYYKLVVTYPSLNKDQSFNMEKELNGTISIVNAQ